MNTEPIIIEQDYPNAAAAVWSALTDNSEMKQWYFVLPEFKAEIGFEFTFEGGTEQKRYLHFCRVTEVIAGRKRAYSWRYDGYPGISYVSFEVSPNGDGARLTLTHSGLETFPGDNPDFAKHNFVAGWTQITGTSLRNYLAGKQG